MLSCSGVFELIKLWAADKAKRWSPNIEQRPFGFSYFLSVDRSTIENKTQQLYVMEKISFSEENFQWGQFSPSILHFQQINLQ